MKELLPFLLLVSLGWIGLAAVALLSATFPETLDSLNACLATLVKTE